MHSTRWSSRRALEEMDQKLNHIHEMLHRMFYALVKGQEITMTSISEINAAIDAVDVEAEETTVAVEAIAIYVTGIKAQMTKIEADLAAALAANDQAGMEQAAAKLRALNAKIDAQQVALHALANTETPPEEEEELDDPEGEPEPEPEGEPESKV